MKNDHTLEHYLSVIDAAVDAGYKMMTMRTFHAQPRPERLMALRHDVDRKPQNALAMARAEAQRDIQSSYYFRSVPSSHDPKVITEIRDLGHEIGYHYEDWHLAKYNPTEAEKLFRKHLTRLTDLADVHTICMHGSPLSSRNNMEFWNHFSPSDYAVTDCLIDMDYTDCYYVTDSGRTWGQTTANLRDEAPGASSIPDIDTSDDLIAAIKTGGYKHISLGCHPERWASHTGDWTAQYVKDQLANSAKRVIRKIRA